MKMIKFIGFIIGGLLINTWIQAQTLTLSTKNIPERHENGTTISVSLSPSSYHFHSPVTNSNWILTSTPSGVSLDSVHRDNNTSATIYLKGNSNIDYDIDLTLLLQVLSADLDGVGSDLTTIGPVKFLAFAEYFSMSGSAQEGKESLATISVTVHGDSLVSVLDTSKWILSNLPTGVTRGNVQRMNDSVAKIYLEGNRTTDYDVNITNLTVTVKQNQLRYNNSDLSVSTGFTFYTHVESITLSGKAYEGSESKDTIAVHLHGATFITPDTSKWTLTNLPGGVKKGNIVLENDSTAWIFMAGNRTVDYDANITNLSVTIDKSQVIANSANLSASTGFTFIAHNESITISGNAYEGRESADTIVVHLHGATFITSPDTTKWTLTNLPGGVKKGNIALGNDSTAWIFMVGNRTVDYDANITNLSVNIDKSQVIANSTNLSASTGFTFIAHNESITISGNAYEGRESGDTIIVHLHGATFIASPDTTKWTLTNLPTGVKKGIIYLLNDSTAWFFLNGNRTVAYVSNITNLTLSIDKSQVVANSTNLAASSGFIFYKQLISITMSGNAHESAESGDTIVVHLHSATFITLPDTSKWTLSNLPKGVGKGNITLPNDSTALLFFKGNRRKDYDQNITNLTLTIDKSQVVSALSNLTSSAGFTFIAVNDIESITLSGSAQESKENGDTITISIHGGTFALTLTKNNWTIANQPQGVIIGSVVRTNDTTAYVILGLNRTKDYDSNIANTKITITTSEYDDSQGGSSLSSSSGFMFIANSDVESLMLYGTANEGSENFSKVLVKLVGGTFASTITQTNWTLSNLPAGVTKGIVNKVTVDSATIQLNGTRTIDYDSNITNLKLTITTSEYDDSQGGGNLADSTGFVFIANNDPEIITLAWNNPPGTNGLESSIGSDKIAVTLNGGTLFIAKIDTSTVRIFGSAVTDAGISIKSISNITSNSFVIALASTGRDYDVDKKLRITLLPAAYAAADSAISGTINLPATFEPALLILTIDSTITEGMQNGKVIHIALQQDTFLLSKVNKSTVMLSGQPDSITIGSINLIDRNHIDIVLNGNSYWDYDSPVTSTIHILDTALMEHKGGEITANYVFTAINDPEVLHLQWDPVRGTNGWEHTLNGEQLLVRLTGGTFKPSNINATNVTLAGNPLTDYGLHIQSVDAATRDSFRITLAWDTIDFDVNKILTVQIAPAAYKDGNTTLSDTITVHAVAEPKFFTHNWANPPGTNGLEATLNNEVVAMKFNGGTLIPANINTGTIKVSGEATSYGVGIKSISNVTKFGFMLHLAWDSTHFNKDKKIIITMSTSAYNASTVPKVDTILLPATYTWANLNLNYRNPPGTNGLEAKLDSEVVHVTLNGGVLIPSKLNTSHVHLAGNAAPDAGLSIRNIQNITRNSFDIALAWNKKDLDVNKILQVQVDTSVYRDGDSTLFSNISVPSTLETATFTKGSIALESDIQLGIDSIVLNLFGATWKPADSGNKYLNSTVDSLLINISFVSGTPSVGDKNMQKIIAAIHGNANSTTHINNSVIRLDNQKLLIYVPAIADYAIQSPSETYSVLIRPYLLVGTTGTIKATPNIIIKKTATTGASIFGGGPICDDGSKATVSVLITGQPPFTLLSITKDNVFYRRFTTADLANINVVNSVFSFQTSDPGIYVVDSLSDKNFLVFSTDTFTDPRLSGTAMIVLNPLPGNVKINGIAPAYAYDGQRVDITSFGFPFGGVFSGSGIFSQAGKYYFYPNVADTSGSPHTIKYVYTDSLHCSNSDTTLVKVLTTSGVVKFQAGKSNYCYNDSIFKVTGENVQSYPGSFSLNPSVASALVFIHGVIDSAFIYPKKLLPGQYTLTYHYLDNGVAFDIDKIFSIEAQIDLYFVGSILTDSLFCSNEDPIVLTGNRNDARIQGSGVTGNLSEGYTFNPIKVTPGPIPITYIYKSPAGCITQTSKLFIVYKVPAVRFDVRSACISPVDSIEFMNNTKDTALVASWSWFFGDERANLEQDTSNLWQPRHFYQTTGGKTISLTSISKASQNSCIVKKDTILILGKKPIPDFSWTNECYHAGIAVPFQIDTVNSSDTYPQDTYYWSFYDAQELHWYDTITSYHNPALAQLYSTDGSYKVELLQKTIYKCTATRTKQVNIRPTIVLMKDSVYTQNFETGKNGWLPEVSTSDTINSWVFGTPANQYLTAAYSGALCWYTKILNTRTTEHSWIKSPCFDLSYMQKPMLNIHIWRNFGNNRDGAVIQYTLDNGKNWLNLGNTSDKALNWYNSFSVVNGPGNPPQTIGWSTLLDPLNGWVESRHWLDDLIGKPNIWFRVAYARSDNTGLGGEGFAFDNVWIGERKHRMVLEQFTSSALVVADSADKVIDRLMRRYPLDISDIKYHLNISGDDPMYTDNQNDPSGRLLYYGIFRVPYSFMDGGGDWDGTGTFSYDYSSSRTTLSQGDIQRRMLDDPMFDIKLNTSISPTAFTITANVKALENIPRKKITLQTVVVQRTVRNYTGLNGEKIFHNVMKKMLPDAAGITFYRSWNAGDTISRTLTWNINKVDSIYQLRAIVFMQDLVTKEVYQAATDDTTKLPVFLTEVNGPLAGDQNDLFIYPNPVRDKVFFELDHERNTATSIIIYDMMGVVKKIVVMQSMQKSAEVDLKGFATGVYIVRPNTADIPVKRLVVMK